MVDRFETQVIGNGPAGIGVPLKALAQGESSYEALTEKGLAMIGPAKDLGAGNLSYKIRSNSAASDFLETVPAAVLEQISEDQALAQIRSKGAEIIGLELIANFEQAVGKAVSQTLESTQSGQPVIDALVSRVEVNRDGELVSYDEDENPIAVSRNVVFSVGAKQEPLNLGEHDEKCTLSDDFLRYDPETIRQRTTGKKIVVIGGAHSAFSCIDNIRSAGVTSPIKLCHRNGFKLYYPSEAEAKKAQYGYKPIDVDDGKIHRFDGIRGDAQSRYQQVRSGQDEHTSFRGYGGDLDEISQELSDADFIIQASGYSPKTIPVFNIDGDRASQDPVDVNEQFSPLLIGGGRIFYNGIAITPRDGVNLFQGGFSQKILSQLIQ